MSEIIKICKIHGELKINEIYIVNRKNRKKTEMRCKKCQYNIYKKKYEEDKRKKPKSIKQLQIEAKKNNACLIHGENVRDKFGACKKCQYKSNQKWRNNNPEKLKIRAIRIRETINKNSRINSRKYRENLSNYYIKILILKKTKNNRKEVIKNCEIPKDIIEIKRLQIKLHRKLKRGYKNVN